MAATAVSRVGSGLLKAQPHGFDTVVALEDSSAASIIPAFTLIGVKADGYGEIAAANTAYTQVGIATAETDVSGDTADGDTSISVRFGCVALLKVAAITIANVGDPVFIVDNQTVVQTDPADATPQIGHITEFVSATEAYVYIAPLIVNP